MTATTERTTLTGTEYEDAPVGTVVALRHPRPMPAMVKELDGRWYHCGLDGLPTDSPGASVASTGLASERRVLHWGSDNLPGSALRALPEGTIIRACRNPGRNIGGPSQHYQWRRTADGWINLVGEPGRRSGPDMDCDDWVTMPVYPEVDLLHRRVALDQLDSLPAGAALVFDCWSSAEEWNESWAESNERFVKSDDGTWVHYFTDGEREAGDFTVEGLRDTFSASFDNGSHWWLSSLSGAEPDPALAVGDPINSIDQLAGLPIGSLLESESGDWFVKTGVPNDWSYARSYAPHQATRTMPVHSFALEGYNTVRRIGPGETEPAAPDRETVAQRVQRAKDDVRDCINEVVSDQGYEWVRDGAFWLLGITELPVVGDRINAGSAFGLPTGSVVRRDAAPGYHGAQLYRVDTHDNQLPTWMAGDESYSTPNYEDSVSIVLLGASETKEWDGYNHFLHTVHQKREEYTTQYGWCRAVLNALNAAGLNDPGDAPDAEELPPLAEGQVIGTVTGQINRALATLPVGSVIYAAGCSAPFVRAGAGWLHANTVHAIDPLDYNTVTITHIEAPHN